MKYQNIDTFNKYLNISFPNNVPNLFFVISKEDFERSKIIDSITCFFPRNNFFAISRYSAEDNNAQEVIANLNSLSLLGDKPVVVLDEVELYKSKDLQLIVSYLKDNKLKSYCVLAARDKKSLLTLFSEVDKRGVILDVSQEKTYEKEKRLSSFITERFAQNKKSISIEARDLILTLIGLDMCMLQNEIDKISLFVGSKTNIEKEDVEAICSSLGTMTPWQIAEKIIFEEDPFIVNLEKDYYIDASFFQSLITALRYNLQEGYKVSSALEKNLNLNELFMSTNAKILEKRKSMAKIHGSEFFKEALKELFEIDLLSKSGMSSYLFLIDLFRIKLYYLMFYETKACPSSQFAF